MSPRQPESFSMPNESFAAGETSARLRFTEVQIEAQSQKINQIERDTRDDMRELEQRLDTKIASLTGHVDSQYRETRGRIDLCATSQRIDSLESKRIEPLETRMSEAGKFQTKMNLILISAGFVIALLGQLVVRWVSASMGTGGGGGAP